MAEDITWAGLMMKIDGAGVVIRSEANLILKQAADKVKQTAEEKFGTYQSNIGPFNGWSAMSSDYLAYKLSKGGGDTPLIGVPELNKVYSAPLKDTLETKLYSAELRAEVGTNDPLGEWHEYGKARKTNFLPPRPFLRPALYQNQDWIVESMEVALGVKLKSWFK